MTANKPETAVQGCAFFSLESHTVLLSCIYSHVYYGLVQHAVLYSIIIITQ